MTANDSQNGTEKKVNREHVAWDLGRKAFENGLIAAPAMDPEMMELLRGMKVGTGAADLLKSWLNGWTIANLSS